MTLEPELPAVINILLLAGATAGAITGIFALLARFGGLVRWVAGVVTRAVRDVMDEDLEALREQVADVGRQVEGLDARVAEDHARTEDKIRSLDVRVARLEGGAGPGVM